MAYKFFDKKSLGGAVPRSNKSAIKARLTGQRQFLAIERAL